MKYFFIILMILANEFAYSQSQSKTICSSPNKQTSIEIKKELIFTNADESVEKMVNIITIQHKGHRQKYIQGEMYSFSHPYKNTTFIKEDLDNINLFAIKFNNSRNKAALYGKDLNWGLIVKPHVIMNCQQINY